MTAVDKILYRKERLKFLSEIWIRLGKTGRKCFGVEAKTGWLFPRSGLVQHDIMYIASIKIDYSMTYLAVIDSGNIALFIKEQGRSTK
jgi:hypothetical protein